jgi:hypothetical protein
MNIEIPLTTFYHRLVKYKIGDASHYINARNNSKAKFCFNPYIATECDVQVKLGGIIEEYFILKGLPYSVNAEMKIYSGIKNNRADLSIHNVSADTLYTEIDSPLSTLVAAFEIKYSNAVHPNEFETDLIKPDLDKLKSLPKEVKKIFVFIDEANGLSDFNVQSYINECAERDIQLFSNNKRINEKQNYLYGK